MTRLIFSESSKTQLQNILWWPKFSNWTSFCSTYLTNANFSEDLALSKFGLVTLFVLGVAMLMLLKLAGGWACRWGLSFLGGGWHPLETMATSIAETKVHWFEIWFQSWNSWTSVESENRNFRNVESPNYEFFFFEISILEKIIQNWYYWFWK